MDPKKKEQLAELKKDRAKLIGALRSQLNASRSLDDIKLLLKALVSLQETQLLLEQWEQKEKSASA